MLILMAVANTRVRGAICMNPSKVVIVSDDNTIL
jgi:hypothetical protein